MDFLDEFDFTLPEEQIARFPSPKRDESRLLLLNRANKTWSEGPLFRDIQTYLRSGDVLVYNETKVSHRRVYLQNEQGKIFEALFLEPEGKNDDWICLLKNRSKLKLHQKLYSMGEVGYDFEVKEFRQEFTILHSAKELSESDFSYFGNIPIPPYLKRKATEEDNLRYQTIFAKTMGSVAAPTAGLHFTEELKESLSQIGIFFTPVHLQIGYGTFRPLSEEQWKSKTLHKEMYSLPEETAEILNQAKKENRRIIAIGTTSLRTLETAYDSQFKRYLVKSGQTDIFITADDTIESVQGLITNFHLPKSSLLMLVSAMAGRKFIMDAYRYAVANQFRFYSYGDSMFIF